MSTPPTGQSCNNIDHENKNGLSNDASHVYGWTNNIRQGMCNVISRNQQLAFANSSNNFLSKNGSPHYAYPNQFLYSPMPHPFLLVRLIPQYFHQQQPMGPINMLPPLLDLSMVPTDIDEQQEHAFLPTIEASLSTVVNSAIPELCEEEIDHGGITDGLRSPVSDSTVLSEVKKARNNPRHIPKSNKRSERDQRVSTRVFYPSNRSHNIRNPSSEQPKKSTHLSRFFHNQPIDLDCSTTQYWLDENKQSYVFSSTSLYNATAPVQFAPFVISFWQKVDAMAVVDELIKHSLHDHQFNLELVTYRDILGENSKSRILIYVQNNKSFSFLNDFHHWPAILANCDFILKRAPIPTLLSLVLTTIPGEIDWKTFVQAVKEKYTDISDIISINSTILKPVRIAKLGFKTIRSRNEVYAVGHISILNMKLKVYEHRPKARVLVCNNCFQIGHFRKICPQKHETTCGTCAENYPRSLDHSCTGVLYCLHCGGPHQSTDHTCPALKDYQSIFTNFLISKITPSHVDSPSSLLALNDHQSYCAVAQVMSFDINEEISEKLDHVLAKVKEEPAPTGATFRRLRSEMRGRYIETNQKVDKLEKSMELMRKKLNDLSKQILQ